MGNGSKNSLCSSPQLASAASMNAGLNIKIPVLESVREKVSLRQQNFSIEGKYPSKDKVIVDVNTKT